MRRIPYLLALLLAMVSVAVFPTAGASAITYGFVDTNNTYSNTGAFIVKSPSTGQIFPICSGTLIASTVFLTASHCTAYFTYDLAPRGYTAFVSFDPSIPFGDLTSRRTNLIAVTQVVTNPNYNPSQSDSGDIAVLLLPERETRGITPATLPKAGLLDELAVQDGLHDAVFTNVGYGVQNRVVGGGVPYFQDRNPIPRMFSFSSFDALNSHYLRLSQNPATGDGGTCFGDSGGPIFFVMDEIQILVAITITGDAVCRATNVTYRLDTTSAREFLGSFVLLP
jgi:Trypsin